MLWAPVEAVLPGSWGGHQYLVSQTRKAKFFTLPNSLLLCSLSYVSFIFQHFLHIFLHNLVKTKIQQNVFKICFRLAVLLS